MSYRRATLILVYDGVNISRSIAEFVTGFTFTDNSGGEADDLNVSVQDRDDLWKSGWYPERGAKLEASILCENWLKPGGADLILPCGKFELDEVEMSAGPDSGDVVTLKGVSALVKTSIRREKRSKPWENVSLSVIAGDIAAAHKLAIQFEGNDATYTRIDQRQESDLEFLNRLAEGEGNSLKLADGRIIIYSGHNYEQNPISHTIVRGQSDISTPRLRSKTAKVYRACTVKYHDPSSKSLKTYTFAPPSAPPSGEILQINKSVESIAHAERMARSLLRKANKNETGGTIPMMGDPRFAATMNIGVSGFHKFDKKYFIDTATHAYTRSGGYKTDLQVHAVLGY